jgi:hypothetical protein
MRMKINSAMLTVSVFCCPKMVGGDLRLWLLVEEVVSPSAGSSQVVWCFSTTKKLV